MRRVLAGLLLLLVTPLLTGCWDRLEVMDLGIVMLAGVDTAEAGVRLTVTVLVPSRVQTPGNAAGAAGGGGKGGARYSAVGETLMDAMSDIQTQVARRLFWGHTRALIFGEEYAGAGVRPALDFWTRHPEPGLLMHIIVTRGTAVDFMGAQPELERTLTEAVREINLSWHQVYVTLKDFLWALASPGEHPVAPLFALSAGTPDQPQREVRVAGAALFREDRMIAALDAADSRGLLWLRGGVHRGVVAVSLPTGGKVSLQIRQAKTAVRTEVANGRPAIRVMVTAELEALESTGPIDLGKAETYRVITDLTEKDVRERILGTLEKVKETGVDVVRFADSVRIGAPRLWEKGGLAERWDQEFAKVPVRLFVTARMVRAGKTGAPPEYREKQVRQGQKQLLKEGK